MKAEQIAAMDAMGLSERGWLREIALQLALLNSKGFPVEIIPVIEPEPLKRGPGRPKKVIQ